MDMAERIMRIDKKRRTLHLIEIGTQLAFVSMYAWMFFFRLIDPTMMMIFLAFLLRIMLKSTMKIIQ